MVLCIFNKHLITIFGKTDVEASMNSILKSLYATLIIILAFVSCGGSGSDDGATATYYQDSDGDLYGNPAVTQVATSQPSGYVLDNTDCDDTSAAVNPSATEIADGIDNNCDGQVNEGYTTYYQDSDNDLYGNPTVTQTTTSQPTGYVTDNTDCDDTSAAINPSATEIPSDGIDNNCNGQTDEAPITTVPLNDTGITWGANSPKNNNTTCIGETINQQDCSHGRDVTHNDDSDGHAGFSYTKLDGNGNDQLVSTANWSCVRDNVSGLIWEVKQGGNEVRGDEGLHDSDDGFSWYSTNYSTNGGNDGTADVGALNGGVFSGNFCHGYDETNSSTFCNTEAYVARVNTTGLCGANDWRMPTLTELGSLVFLNNTDESIDLSYFPNINRSTNTFYILFGSFYWSGSPYAVNTNNAWAVNFNGGIFTAPERSAIINANTFPYINYKIRLVRTNQ